MSDFQFKASQKDGLKQVIDELIIKLENYRDKSGHSPNGRTFAAASTDARKLRAFILFEAEVQLQD